MGTHSKTSVELFTPDEHAILAKWFGAEPPASARGINVKDAAARLGLTKEPWYRTLLDVTVAHIVLKNVEGRLPQWAVLAGEELVQTRQYRDDTGKPDRRILLRPQLLVEINWADSGPGFSWPLAYFVTWLPYYDRFVVTASADTPEPWGYCDYAVGSFGIQTPIKEGSSAIIRSDWRNRYDEWEQERWVYLFRTGLISEAEASALADEVWPAEQDDEDAEDAA